MCSECERGAHRISKLRAWCSSSNETCRHQHKLCSPAARGAMSHPSHFPPTRKARTRGAMTPSAPQLAIDKPLCPTTRKARSRGASTPSAGNEQPAVSIDQKSTILRSEYSKRSQWTNRCVHPPGKHDFAERIPPGAQSITRWPTVSEPSYPSAQSSICKPTYSALSHPKAQCSICDKLAAPRVRKEPSTRLEEEP